MRPSIDVQERVQLEVGLEQAWEMLTDAGTVVSCMPGAEVIDIEDDGTVRGALTVSLGPTETRFEGRVTPSFNEEQRTGGLQGKGSDGRGRTRAAVETTFKLEEVDGRSDRTDLVIDSTIMVSGALAGFAKTGGQTVARQLLHEFAGNLAEFHRAAWGAEAAEERASEDVEPRRLGGFGLLFRALREAIRRAFGRRRRVDT